MGELLECIEVGPGGGSPQGVQGSVIWLHGLGADGHDFEPIVPMLGLPEVRFVFPHAPVMPVTINGGYAMRAWYDIRTLERAPDRESAEDIRASATLVEALLAREVERGVPPDRIVLAGFSQGAAMALFVGLRHTQTLAGLVVLSGYRVLADTFDAERSEANRRAPIFFAHGVHDDVLPVAQGRDAFEHAKGAHDGEVEWHDYPIPHSVCEPEILEVSRWLHERFD